jgi:hypothetical protein
MKMNIYPVIMLLIATLFVSCKKDHVYGDEFSESEETWRDFKASSNNSYRYMVSTGSWAGSRSETIVTVENGQVVGRSYVSKVRGDSSIQMVIREHWEEDASSLGSHTGGAEPLTLDKIYQRAKSDWLKKREDAETYFETRNNGMISLCGYVPNGCVDDCFRGITIDYIENL